MGVREDGQKVLLAVKNMGGESAEAWRSVLDQRECAVVRDFEPANVSCGSFTTGVEPAPGPAMLAVPPKADVANFLQALAKSAQTTRHGFRGYGAKVGDRRHCRLLCPRRQRPRCSAAEQADELPPPHAGHGLAPRCAAYHSSWNRRVQAV
jgi:hypothetical protein